MLAHILIPTDGGNEAIRSGRMGSLMKDFLEKTKAEAAYFAVDHEGERSGYIVFDMKDSSEMPPLFEPLFQELHARI
ncbi:MAG: hypothetical protein JO101_08315, partial [Candidatus Eremiobacteraeota bacterium]|nr:hypothetical protein [Candidatus Eremiobacteraeota bacterium]